MRNYLVTFRKTYRDTFQGEGRQFSIEENVTHRIEDVPENNLPALMTALREKGYSLISATDSTTSW